MKSRKIALGLVFSFVGFVASTSLKAEDLEQVNVRADVGFMDCRLSGPSSENCYLPVPTNTTYSVVLYPERYSSNFSGAIELRSFRDGWEFIGRLNVTKLTDRTPSIYMLTLNVRAYGRGQVLIGYPTHVFVNSMAELNEVFSYGLPMGIIGSNTRYFPSISINTTSVAPALGPLNEPRSIKLDL